MIVNKITIGYVTQIYDSTKKKWMNQYFTTGDQVSFTDQSGNTLFGDKLTKSGLLEAYLSFDMVQPKEKQ
jgi:hypothetical protein